jgi:hypothetical protein
LVPILVRILSRPLDQLKFNIQPKNYTYESEQLLARASHGEYYLHQLEGVFLAILHL